MNTHNPYTLSTVDFCKGSNESIKDFNDRFNLILKKI
jgi:hypothetical protein